MKRGLGWSIFIAFVGITGALVWYEHLARVPDDLEMIQTAEKKDEIETNIIDSDEGEIRNDNIGAADPSAGQTPEEPPAPTTSAPVEPDDQARRTEEMLGGGSGQELPPEMFLDTADFYSERPQVVPEALNPIPQSTAAPPGSEVLERLRAEREAEIEALNQALESLSEGDFFHTIPAEMEVNKPVIIEAGIAAQEINEVIERHNVTADLETQPGILYDPLGTEIELIAPDDAFTEEIISAGRKTIFEGDEPIWSWRVIPTKAGSHLIILKVRVELRSPATGKVYNKEFITFRQHRQVNVNYAYSMQSFFANNWEEILTRVIGSGTICGAVGWLAGKRQQRLRAASAKPKTFVEEALK